MNQHFFFGNPWFVFYEEQWYKNLNADNSFAFQVNESELISFVPSTDEYKPDHLYQNMHCLGTLSVSCCQNLEDSWSLLGSTVQLDFHSHFGLVLFCKKVWTDFWTLSLNCFCNCMFQHCRNAFNTLIDIFCVKLLSLNLIYKSSFVSIYMVHVRISLVMYTH